MWKMFLYWRLPLESIHTLKPIPTSTPTPSMDYFQCILKKYSLYLRSTWSVSPQTLWKHILRKDKMFCIKFNLSIKIPLWQSDTSWCGENVITTSREGPLYRLHSLHSQDWVMKLHSNAKSTLPANGDLLWQGRIKEIETKRSHRWSR